MTTPIQLRPFQAKALRSLKNRYSDLICISPTGSGKGVIVEEIAKDPKERVLLVSPLIALGRQQKSRFEVKEIPTFCSMGSELKFLERHQLLAQARVWILSPESAVNPQTTALIRKWKPTLVVIDECHCISEWGSDFRPAYGKIPTWVSSLSVPRTLWMSATLPLQGKALIDTGLGRKTEIQGSFLLPEHLEISFLKTPWSHRLRILTRYLEERKEGGIIFTGSRSMTERLYRLVQAQGRETYFYHAGLASEERRIVEAQIPRSPDSIIVATSAFGMGMDYSNLTWVLMWQPPRTVLSLAQALGRVGRNQRQGQAVLMWDEEDLRFAQDDVKELLKKDASEHHRNDLKRFFH